MSEGTLAALSDKWNGDGFARFPKDSYICICTRTFSSLKLRFLLPFYVMQRTDNKVSFSHFISSSPTLASGMRFLHVKANANTFQDELVQGKRRRKRVHVQYSTVP